MKRGSRNVVMVLSLICFPLPTTPMQEDADFYVQRGFDFKAKRTTTRPSPTSTRHATRTQARESVSRPRSGVGHEEEVRQGRQTTARQ